MADRARALPYDEDLAQRVLDRIAAGELLRDLWRDPAMPTRGDLEAGGGEGLAGGGLGDLEDLVGQVVALEFAGGGDVAAEFHALVEPEIDGGQGRHGRVGTDLAER